MNIWFGNFLPTNTSHVICPNTQSNQKYIKMHTFLESANIHTGYINP